MDTAGNRERAGVTVAGTVQDNCTLLLPEESEWQAKEYTHKSPQN